MTPVTYDSSALRHKIMLAGLSLFLANSVAADEPSDVTELSEVIIEQEGEPESDLPLGTGISGESLRTVPGSGGDPLRGLQSLPGMTFTDDSEAAPAVRGSRPSDNYMEADFVPVGYLFHAGGVISVFNSELIESFDIYSSAYGPEFYGVTGAVLDIELRDPKDDRLHTTIDASFLQTGVLVEGPVTENQSFYLAGRMSYLDLFVKGQLEDEDGIEFKQFPKYSDYQGKYVWRLSQDSTVRLQLNGATDKQEIIVADDSVEIDNEPALAGRHFESTQFHEQAVVWDKTFGQGVTLKSAISHVTSDSKAQFGNAGEVDVEVDRFFVKSHATIPLNDQHDLKIGGELAKIKADFRVAFNDPGCTEFEVDCVITGAERLDTVESANINAAHFFVKDNWYVNENITLYPGLVVHGEDYLDKAFVEPRFSAEYSARDDLILSAGAGVYHQMPDFIEVNDVFGNPDLDYIQSLHGVVGVQKSFADGWSVKTELYYKSLDKLVAGDDENRYSNDGKGYAYGVEALIRKDMSDKLTGWLSVSISEAKRKHKVTGDSFVFDYDQPFNASLVAKYKVSGLWDIGAKLWVHSGSAYTPIIGATADEDIEGLYIPQYGAINSKRFPFYNRLDLRVERTFLRKNGKKNIGYLELLNVLDTRNISSYDYNSDYSERTEVTQLPRIIAFGFKAEF